ncbi:ABC transporter permease subunit [Xinfangfangia sp. CPCC 101601]|uniref:ABC transporter permease subunit n=1 Tax=Pseudogemmobacter lacusdianii TaxID=3069608 RepID=A0ABU0W271_9RHOB|nr:ABC transporter permease subunit [Xinfangfangia sp. CPCC 101601]MDQ2068118.1 ABC transporter permease subunit [Xinfangfangia sp. CPCC 101601]
MVSSSKRRAYLLQMVIGLVLVAVLAALILGAKRSLDAQNITSGYGFLWRSTGWNIGFSLIPYSINDPYWKVIAVGILNTLYLGGMGLIFATVLGLIVGACRTSTNAVLRAFGTCYVETIRNIPLILQAFFWYAVFTNLPSPRQAINLGDMLILSARGIFTPALNIAEPYGLLAGMVFLGTLIAALVLALLPRRDLKSRLLYPKLGRAIWFVGGLGLILVILLGKVPGEPLLLTAELKGLNFTGGLRLSPEFAALLTAMSLYGGAFLGEIIRAGFLSVSKGQVEAAEALGLSGWQVFTKVRMPLAFRAVLPTLTNQYVWLLKATTLGIAVGYADFFLVISTAINQSGQTIELITILMIGFLIINNLLAAFMNLINKRIALRGTQLRS